ncbi:unnamed protein product [Heligmosomoides polygyrus]|uniref:Secreted protein n=1 Tax=Heligmosomoides polygyrus TaxID=6339 RepID=A0A183G4C9_HELPZ|nr:unnamed protein product [Heligmosomoides polygyrus]
MLLTPSVTAAGVVFSLFGGHYTLASGWLAVGVVPGSTSQKKKKQKQKTSRRTNTLLLFAAAAAASSYSITDRTWPGAEAAGCSEGPRSFVRRTSSLPANHRLRASEVVIVGTLLRRASSS